VGKTVFLAGSYAELHSGRLPNHAQHLWFDCQDSQVQENIESILSYVARTGQYPPPTIKITNFDFSLKYHSSWGNKTLCHFRWWDIPGESCNITNPDFRAMVFNSHGCCVFIDAFELVHNNAYLETLEENLILQVTAIADLVSLMGSKYVFALILTKCDLLEPDLMERQRLEKGLQPLINRLDVVAANYQIFYSVIPIVSTEGTPTLRPTGAAAPFLWLIWELSKADNQGLSHNLLMLIAPLLPRRLKPQRVLTDGLIHGLYKPEAEAFGVKKLLNLLGLRWKLLSTPHKAILILALASLTTIGVIGPSLYERTFQPVLYEWVLQWQPNNLDALQNLATLRLRRGQVDEALPLLEKLVQQEPEQLEWRLQLAQIYQSTGQLAKAETAYDQILAQQKNYFKALVGKATLRAVQGDTATSQALFVQAEKTAPAALKEKVQAVAQETLQVPTKPFPAAK
jgi:hypothetical protein